MQISWKLRAQSNSIDLKSIQLHLYFISPPPYPLMLIIQKNWLQAIDCLENMWVLPKNNSIKLKSQFVCIFPFFLHLKFKGKEIIILTLNSWTEIAVIRLHLLKVCHSLHSTRHWIFDICYNIYRYYVFSGFTCTTLQVFDKFEAAESNNTLSFTWPRTIL